MDDVKPAKPSKLRSFLVEIGVPINGRPSRWLLSLRYGNVQYNKDGEPYVDVREPIISHRLFLILLIALLFAYPVGYGAAKGIIYVREQYAELFEDPWICGTFSLAHEMGPFKADDPNRPLIEEGCWDKFGNSKPGADGADAD